MSEYFKDAEKITVPVTGEPVSNWSGEMKKISKLLHVPKELSLGYLDSESLVAMNKTPNNTFPVYWHEGKGHSHAPFPRRENVKMIRTEKREE